MAKPKGTPTTPDEHLIGSDELDAYIVGLKAGKEEEPDGLKERGAKECRFQVESSNNSDCKSVSKGVTLPCWLKRGTDPPHP